MMWREFQIENIITDLHKQIFLVHRVINAPLLGPMVYKHGPRVCTPRLYRTPVEMSASYDNLAAQLAINN